MNRTPNTLLRRAREARGWTQRHLAEELGVEKQTIGSWEQGSRSPSLEMRSRLYKVFEMTPEQLGLHPSQELPRQTDLLDSQPHLSSTEVDTINQNMKQRVQAPPVRLTLHPGNNNRQRMLKRVSFLWIAGILEHSLYNSILITLQLREQPDAVENPWRQAVQESNLPPHALPTETRIMQIYDAADGELLILGEPGAGKTTLLLELTRDLLERASANQAHPMPVVFNLSSWTEERQPFTEWLVEELNTKYQVPHNIAQEWVMTNQILPLLDGLDEIAEIYRTACVEAINRYRREHGFVPMVVCSRSVDYFALSARILLRNAVVVQPLTKEQINAYLSNAGEKLDGLQMALQNDALLQDIASTPLMLNILTHISSEGALPGDAFGAQQHLIFEKYVERVLQRRGPIHRYTFQQTTNWLAWLAQQMVQHNQTEFYIERMQPDWLPGGLRQPYHNVIVRLIYGFECLVVAALFALVRGGQVGNLRGVKIGLLGWLGSGPGNSVLGWMAPGFGGGIEGGGSLGIIIALVFALVTLLVGMPSLPILSLKACWHGLLNGGRTGFRSGVIVGVFCMLLFGFGYGIRQGLTYGLSDGLFVGLFVGLPIGLIAGLHYEQNSLQMRHIKSGQKRSFSDRLLDGLSIGLCAGLIFGIIDGLLHVGLDLTVIYASIVGLCGGIAFGFGGGTNLIPGLGREIKPAETVVWSWHHVRRNLAGNMRKGLLIGLVVMISVSMMIGCASSLFYGPGYGLRYGLVYGFIVGFVVGVAGILAGMLNSGWSSDILAEHQQFRPNEGTMRSARNAVFAACLFGPIGGIASGLAGGLAFGLVGRLDGWLILGVGFAITLGIIFALEIRDDTWRDCLD